MGRFLHGLRLGLQGTVLQLPTRDQIDLRLTAQLIVELLPVKFDLF